MTGSQDTHKKPLGERLIAAAREARQMTRDEYEAQRKSWVIGELMLAHPKMTRDEAEGIYEKALGQYSGRLSFADIIGSEGG